ncbi:MAG: 50S ribosomal protein L17 [Deltaproteobacteria bacterium]|nr:50S ribosomal protein L17 [Deltaproteobacteria bacterium]
MRHRKAGKKLNRTSSHRRLMFRNMLTSFFDSEKIETTDAKAKVLKKEVDKLITLGKKGDLHSRRIAAKMIRDKEVLKKLFDDIAKRFKNRISGYTRIVKLGWRQGDGAPTSLIELLPDLGEEKKEKKVTKKEDKTKEKTTKKKKETVSKAKTDKKSVKKEKKVKAKKVEESKSEKEENLQEKKRVKPKN